MLCEAGLDDFAPLSRHSGVGAFLIKLHKAAVPGDISSEDYCKSSHRSLARGWTILAAAY
jgi:hypothetical protein